MAPGGVAFVPFMPELKMRNPGKPGARMPDFDLLKPLVHAECSLCLSVDSMIRVLESTVAILHSNTIRLFTDQIKFGNANKRRLGDVRQ